MNHYGETKPLLHEGVYDNLAITQRGVATRKNNPEKEGGPPPVPFVQKDGARVTHFPTIKCLHPLSDYASNAVRAAYTVAGKDPKLLVELLVELIEKGRGNYRQYMALRPDLVEVLSLVTLVPSLSRLDGSMHGRAGLRPTNSSRGV